MKIGIISDLHFGARNDSPVFDDFFRKFYSEIFFPYLKKNDINTVVILGDVFDRRKLIYIKTLYSCREYFFDAAKAQGIKIHILAGNHDVTYKNTNVVNSIELLLNSYDNIEVIVHPKMLNFGGTDIQMIPWICADNYDESMSALKTTTADIVFGHFEIAGFAMYKGNVCEQGFDKKLFERFDLCLSGHFHHRSFDGNITYVGSPYEIISADREDPRGFHIFETETRELEFIRNPYTMFIEDIYDDVNYHMDTKDLSWVKGKCVKLNVIHKSDQKLFEKYIEAMKKWEPIDLKIAEDYSKYSSENVEDSDIDIQDTMALLSSYIDSIETDLDSKKIKEYMNQLYLDALHQVTE